LTTISEQGAKELLLEEIGEYLPIAAADVESAELNSNIGLPLFINTIGAWPNRPRPKSKVPNLYMAGDFVRNAIDLACMEGAVCAALDAAGHILVDHGEPGPGPVVQTPPVWPRALLVTARILLIPLVALARLLAAVEEKFAPHSPDASSVHRDATPRLRNDPRPPRKR
jgi:hypothetical protein